MMTATVRMFLTSLTCVMVMSAALSQPTTLSWMPDEATVRSIDSKLKLPSMGRWASGPLDSYARYYVGLVQNGRKVIYGDLLRGRMAQEKPGIYLRAAASATGGGCDQIQLWFDVKLHTILHIQCYGLG